jgi:hypothetical protein
LQTGDGQDIIKCCDTTAAICKATVPCPVDERTGFTNCSYPGLTHSFDNTSGIYTLTNSPANSPASVPDECGGGTTVRCIREELDDPACGTAEGAGDLCGDGYCDIASVVSQQIQETCASCPQVSHRNNAYPTPYIFFFRLCYLPPRVALGCPLRYFLFHGRGQCESPELRNLLKHAEAFLNHSLLSHDYFFLFPYMQDCGPCHTEPQTAIQPQCTARA